MLLMKKCFLILIMGVLISCNDTLVTDLEKQAVDSVLDFYGGICYRSKGFSSENTDVTTYFELKMVDSERIQGQMDKDHLPSSNVAYLFYKNLKEEKENYDEIHVILVSEDKSEQQYIFPVALLERVEKRMMVIEETIEMIKNKRFESLHSILNNELVPFEKEELITNLKKVEPQFGVIEEFQFFGFKVIPYKGKDILHLAGAVIRDKQNTEFSIDIDFNSDKNELYQLQYKL